MITKFKKSSLFLIFLGAFNDIYANPPIYAKATTDVAFKQAGFSNTHFFNNAKPSNFRSWVLHSTHYFKQNFIYADFFH